MDSAPKKIPPSTQGEWLKQAHLQNHEARRAYYVLLGRRAILEHLLEHGEGTADAVYPAVKLPTGVDPRCLGSVPGMLARAGIIRAAGYVKSSRPERHASVLQVWKLQDPQAARDWLKANPLPIEPPPEISDPGFSNPSQPPKNGESRQISLARHLSGSEHQKGEFPYAS